MSQNRTKLEQVATNSVQRIGINNLSFRTLADEVGIKSSSVHYYFPEKGNLANAIIINYTTQFSEQLDQIDIEKSSPQQKLEAFVKIFEKTIKADKLCLCGMMAAEISSLHEESRLLLKKYFLLVENWLNKIFTQHQESLTIDIKPRELAKIVMSGLEGAILIDRVDSKSNRLQSQRKLIRCLID